MRSPSRSIAVTAVRRRIVTPRERSAAAIESISER